MSQSPTITSARYDGKQVLVSWTPSDDSNVTGYTIQLHPSSNWNAVQTSPFIQGRQTTSGALTPSTPLSIGTMYSVQVNALHQSSGQQHSSPSVSLWVAPSLRTAWYDGQAVFFEWTPLQGAAQGVVLQVIRMDTGATWSATVPDPTASQGQIPASALPAGGLDPTKQWAAAVVPLGYQVSGSQGSGYQGSGSQGSGSQGSGVPRVNFPKPLPTLASPQVIHPAGGDLQVQWSPVTGSPPNPPITRYLVRLVLGPDNAIRELPATGGDTSLAGQVTATTPYFGVQLIALDAGGAGVASPYQQYIVVNDRDDDHDVIALTGPASPLPSPQPRLLAVDVDGVQATVVWEQVPGATGYVVSLLDTTAGSVAQQATAGANARSLVFEPNPTPGAHYAVVVQASFGTSVGVPSRAFPLIAPAFFLSTQQATTFYPFVYPAGTLGTVLSNSTAQQPADLAGEDLTLYLPEIGGSAGLQSIPGQGDSSNPVTSLPAQGPFKLIGSGDSRYPYALEIAGGSSAWAFGADALRTSLRSDYIAFLQAVEQAGGTPWGVALLQQCIGRYLPQTFEEQLYYNFGLTYPADGSGVGSADLRPGMVLRVAAADFLAVGGTSNSPWLNGYVAGPVIDYDVGSSVDSHGWQVGFDAFISRLVANGALTVAPPRTDPNARQQSGVADAADLSFPGFRQPFYRVFFPTALAPPSAPGDTQTPLAFTVAAAPSFTALSNTVNVPGQGSALAYFRGRAILKLCLRVTVNGAESVVPVGTTVGHLLERLGRRPPPAPVALRGVRFERALGPVVLDPAAPFDVARRYAVRLDWGTLPVYDPELGWDALSLPLLPGDRLTFES